MGISVTDETLERATRVKRLIGRPQESAKSERKSTTRFGEEPESVLCKCDNIESVEHKISY
ncbi:hypothetical protein [Lysinibacillus sp. G4S2]|uniref:hypothetical protein n=1 Tax=Lysinibacillus sp. G4S2 TaxID=3055859 RepID=UPI0025A2B151|nr:hypothetical protein [Lysinibacillus sp. G4S2]MDM5248356.1 hypothetical protein [Lysinibacillus sp. G4S2]